MLGLLGMAYGLLVALSPRSARIMRWRRRFEWSVFLDFVIIATYDVALAACIQLRQGLLPRDPYYLISAILAYFSLVFIGLLVGWLCGIPDWLLPVYI